MALRRVVRVEYSLYNLADCEVFLDNGDTIAFVMGASLEVKINEPSATNLKIAYVDFVRKGTSPHDPEEGVT
jgi:hypothetical protein